MSTMVVVVLLVETALAVSVAWDLARWAQTLGDGDTAVAARDGAS